MTGLAYPQRALPADGDGGEAGFPWEHYRRELTGHCYRMLGSSFDAEDAVQETMVRAWRGYSSFEGRSALRSWLYRIATNVCLSMLEGRKRRARPMDLGPASRVDAALPEPAPESVWLQPAPDAVVLPSAGDPAELAVARESVRLAFVAALQHLPPRQRAVLILRQVLQWSAAEVAQLLDTTVASVNSAQQRARATLAARDPGAAERSPQLDGEDAALLARYAEAFERYDIDELVELLHEDAIMSMPPYPLWLRGRRDIRGWWLGPGAGCAGSRLVPTRANGAPAFGQYRLHRESGRYQPFALQVLEFRGGLLVDVNAFLDTEALFPLFGLPKRLDGAVSYRDPAGPGPGAD